MDTNQTGVLSDPKETMRKNLAFLREFAKRVIVDEDDSLPNLEDIKETLMREYLAVGKSLKLTQRDLAILLFKGILDKTIKLDA